MGGEHISAGQTHQGRTWPGWALAAVAVWVLGVFVLTLTPTGVAVTRAAMLAATSVNTLARHAPRAPQGAVQAHPFVGSDPVGALFRLNAGRLGPHFCTATVVDSPSADLVVTAAHCVSGRSAGRIAFVPDYHADRKPFGVWVASRVLVDAAWQKSASPDHDVAFLVVHQAGNPRQVQQVTGGEHLGIGWRAEVPVVVIGYNSGNDGPIGCPRRTRPFGRREMEIVCGGFFEGTSGGPFLMAVASQRGPGTVVGVIGGYEQGGDLAPISYSPRFGHAVWSLYEAAVSAG
ncbi:MAG TPA: trypsin-like serine protease [Streptosporangiaceae bacterium]|nr:trypsin-like serine protease [Streptosporangiaceae bacterium]